jgi:pimeloyl-ACP methyl ester carboxylesterase
MPRRSITRRWLLAAAALALTLTALSSSVASSRSHPGESTPARSKPTVVLVHGAFADASGWSAVISRLQRRGYPVIAPPNPLRGVAGDSAYIKSVLATVTGPIVLAGHCDGGFVITNAATGNPQRQSARLHRRLRPRRERHRPRSQHARPRKHNRTGHARHPHRARPRRHRRPSSTRRVATTA